MLHSWLSCILLLLALPAIGAVSTNGGKPIDAILFAPAKPKYTVIVFTDVDCPYCRKLHGELGQLQARGIAVRYLAFPRSGPDTKAWHTMAAVWCSSDRRDALTRAMRGDAVNAKSSCSDGVIAKHYALGQQLGIPGTPMIVASDGTSLGGYLPPDKLLAALEEHAPHGDPNSESRPAVRPVESLNYPRQSLRRLTGRESPSAKAVGGGGCV